MRFKLFLLGLGVFALGLFMYVESWVKAEFGCYFGGAVLPGAGIIMIIESFEKEET